MIFAVDTKYKHNCYFLNIFCGYKMNVRETHKTALERQITEAVKIDTTNKQTLNRKTGFIVNTLLSLRSSLTSDDTPADF